MSTERRRVRVSLELMDLPPNERMPRGGTGIVARYQHREHAAEAERMARLCVPEGVLVAEERHFPPSASDIEGYGAFAMKWGNP